MTNGQAGSIDMNAKPTWRALYGSTVVTALIFLTGCDSNSDAVNDNSADLNEPFSRGSATNVPVDTSVNGAPILNGPPPTGPYAGPHGPTKPSDDAPIVKVKVGDFFDAFESNPDAVSEKYGKRWVEVTGKVSMFDVVPNDYGNQSHSVVVVLAPHPNSTKFRKFFVTDLLPWRKTSVGSEITIRGVLATSELSFSGYFDHCTIVSNEPKPTPEFTAEELAKAYFDDPDATQDKFDYETLIVSGTLSKHQSGEFKFFQLDGYKDIQIEVGANWEHQFEGLQPGDWIKVIGWCIIGTGDEVKQGVPQLQVGASHRIDFLESKTD